MTSGKPWTKQNGMAGKEHCLFCEKLYYVELHNITLLMLRTSTLSLTSNEAVLYKLCNTNSKYRLYSAYSQSLPQHTFLPSKHQG